MSKDQDRSVFRRPDGKWVNQRHDRSQATSLHDTQADAYAAARANLQNQGGGEISIHGVNGQIRDKNTIPPGNDDFPPKG